LGSYDNATEAVKRYDEHNALIRPVTDPKRKRRYSIRDGWNKEITIGELRKAAKKEQAEAYLRQTGPRSTI
jgi:hypothetical protein